MINDYFSNLDYNFHRGRGISIYNANEDVLNLISKKLIKANKSPLRIKVSDIINSGSLPPIKLKDFDSCIIFQNNDIDELSRARTFDKLINNWIFSFYYHKKPLFFISTINKSDYSVTIQSSLLHTDYNKIINLLLIEQLDFILQNTTFLYSSPDLMNQKIDNYLFTPIEKIMYNALIKKNISFTPQVKIGRYIVDFVVNINNNKIILECDGRDFHNPFHDKKRDKELKLLGLNIIHCTGSEIYENVDSCIEKIINLARIETKQTATIDSDLDQSQKKAINNITGPIRLLAPAGSGKTKTLINRIVNLINNGIDPNKILALAFNKKAKDEMERRLNEKQIVTSNKLNEDGVKVRTFHSFGYEIIRDYLNWKFPGEESAKTKTRRLLKDAIEPYYPIPPRRNRDPLDVFLDALRKTKMELLHIKDVTVDDNGNIIPFENIFNRYLGLQIHHHFFNFDDMIYLALRAILDDNVLRKSLQNKFEFILVDEFQDLNKAQILLMQILALPQNNIFIVGDDDQMIYGWRGAEITHILEFPRRYAEAKDFTLSTNYRSNKRIVYHSKWLIDHNLERVHKNIHPLPSKPPGTFDIKLSNSLWDQAIEIRDWIKQLKQKEQFDWKDFAILYRYNAYQFIISIILDSEQIPHTPVNSSFLFQTNVGKDIFSYLRIILYPQDCSAEDFSRILKRPNRSLSNQIINQITSWKSFLNSPNISGLQQWQKNKLNNVLKKVQIIQKQIKEHIQSSHQLISAISNEFGLKNFYQSLTKTNINLDDSSDEILLEVIMAIAKNKPHIEDFFTYIYNSIFEENNNSEIANEEQRDEVILTTIHKTKGNEYNNVAYFNLESNNKLRTLSDIEEERRVTYVGVTRSIKNILITAPVNNYSVFLEELAYNPDFRDLSTIKLNSYLSQSKREIGIAKNKIKAIETKINSIINKFPELKGETYNITNGLLKNLRIWIRQQLVNQASNKISKLENKKNDIVSNKLVPLNDKIEKIETEIKLRKILQNQNKEKNTFDGNISNYLLMQLK